MRKFPVIFPGYSSQRMDHAHSPSGGSKLQSLTDFGSNPGDLLARTFFPPDLPESAPLVVVLHGCTQDAERYDHQSGWSQLAEEAGFALLFPQQQRANNPNLCFNWFLPGDVRHGSGEVLSIVHMIEACVSKHGLDRRRIFVTGLSAGGAMASALLASYPQLFAGGAIIAGLPYGAATNVGQAFDRMRGVGYPPEHDLQQLLLNASKHEGPWPTISIWQGSADRTVAPANADMIAAQWRGVHKLDDTPTLSESDGLLSKRIWTDRGGRPVLEINRIAGMGHGTPIRPDDLGTPGPYILDVDVSSTRDIAASWGIAEASRGSASPSKSISVSKPQAPRQDHPSSSQGAKPTRIIPEPAAAATGVQKIIEDALRTAGLMR